MEYLEWKAMLTVLFSAKIDIFIYNSNKDESNMMTAIMLTTSHRNIHFNTWLLFG